MEALVAWTKEKIDWKLLSIAKLPKDIQNALGEAEKAMELAAEKQNAARKLITAKLPKAPLGKVARVAITLRDGDVRVAVGLATANEKSGHDAFGLDGRQHPRHPHELRGVPIMKTPSTSETLKRRQCHTGISKGTIRVAWNLVDAALIAAGAKTPGQRARVAWRFSDSIWRQIGMVNPGLSRAINNDVKGRAKSEGWPWVKNLWAKEEIIDDYRQQGFPEEDIAAFIPKIVGATKRSHRDEFAPGMTLRSYPDEHLDE
jgi:hypothetical protein